MSVTRYGRVLVIATAVTGFVGCAPETIDRPPDTTVRIPDAARLTGTVTAVGDDDLVIDIGTARPVTVGLAQIAATNCEAGGQNAFAEGLRLLAPVGRAVVVVRSNGPARAGHDLTAFVHAEDESAVDPTAPAGVSVNEEMLRTGRASLESPLERSATAALADQIAARSGALLAPDHDYFPLLADAETSAWTSGTGPIGACARRQDELDRGRAAIALTPAQSQEAPSWTATVAPAPTPSGLHLEITVQRPSRVRPCERFDRC